MTDPRARLRELIDELVGPHSQAWDLAGLLPEAVLRSLGAVGLLCAEVPVIYGGLGFDSLTNGGFTAHVGALCGSVRSIMTSQGLAAWAIQRLGDADQRELYLTQLTSGCLAAVGFSEPGAGSDLSALSTEIRREDDCVVLDGRKVWVTGACYADLLLIFGRYGDGAAAVVVPATAHGVGVEPVNEPFGCRAAGHAALRLDQVRVPVENVLGGAAHGLPLLTTTVLAYGRISVAWGCVGILRACRKAAAAHAASRTQFGQPLAQHQLVARHLANLLAGEQIAARACEHASRCWDEGTPDQVIAVLMAKYVSSVQAARGAAAAVQVLASAGAKDGHVVARAYRDAKLMEIIEGSTEICQLVLAQHALTAP